MEGVKGPEVRDYVLYRVFLYWIISVNAVEVFWVRRRLDGYQGIKVGFE